MDFPRNGILNRVTSIRLVFSIADIQADSEDLEANAEVEGEADDSAAVYPLRASLSITKSNAPGALNVDMVVQEGHFLVENVSFYEDAKIGTELTAEADWKRRGMYIGPQVRRTRDLTSAFH